MKNAMPSIVRNLAAFSTLLMPASCTTQPTAPVRAASAAGDDTAACIAELGRDHVAALGALDSTNISVVNWNIQKGRNTRWVGDLDEIGMQPDLLILQEASVRTNIWRDLVPGHYESFAEGFGPDWSPRSPSSPRSETSPGRSPPRTTRSVRARDRARYSS